MPSIISIASSQQNWSTFLLFFFFLNLKQIMAWNGFMLYGFYYMSSMSGAGPCICIIMCNKAFSNTMFSMDMGDNGYVPLLISVPFAIQPSQVWGFHGQGWYMPLFMWAPLYVTHVCAGPCTCRHSAFSDTRFFHGHVQVVCVLFPLCFCTRSPWLLAVVTQLRSFTEFRLVACWLAVLKFRSKSDLFFSWEVVT